jgi:SulP family sulfate permease
MREALGHKNVSKDTSAGLVLGVESVPDGLAGGLLAGVNPVFGLYAYMVGTFTGALFTSSAFMAVQATSAMAIVVADVDAVRSGDDPDTALFTLSVLTGIVMLVAGLAKLGSVLRYVSNAVMVGFISAVGVNIVLGQLGDFTGYDADGGSRVVRAIDTALHPGSWDVATVVVGATTIALILLLERTPLGPLGMVVAIAASSAAVALLDSDVVTLTSLAEIPASLPTPSLPDFGLTLELLIPAVSLAFIGLVQGAGISANIPNPDGSYPDASRDFVGQGAANLAAGVFQGMPVGGSMSATSLVTNAGARSRLANLIAGIVIAVVILLFGGLVEQIAMPALAALLMIVGARTVKPRAIESVVRTGGSQGVVLLVTFVLTLLVPLQYAVLVGVGISMILHVVGRANRLRIRRVELSDEGAREVDPPAELGPGEVVVLQPYGGLFFATAAAFDAQVPEVTSRSEGSVVLLRLRGFEELGSTFAAVLMRYAEELQAVGSKLVIVSANERIVGQLEATGAAAVIGEDNLYEGEEWVGRTLRRANADALSWVEDRASPSS